MMIYLSYPIRNFNSSKEVAVIIMLSDNVQYKIMKPLMIASVPPGNVKPISSRTYASRELMTVSEGMIKLTQLEDDERVIKMNNLRGLQR